MRRHSKIFAGLFAGLFALTFGYLSSQPHSATFTNVPLIGVAEKRATLLFVGDMMFDRTIRDDINANGADAIFEGVKPLFAPADFIAGNLEGTITTESSLSKNTNPGEDHNTTFTFDPSVANILAGQGLKLVSIGNNHIADFGVVGVRSTEKFLSKAGVTYVGDPFATSTEPIIENINGIKVGFVAYDQFIEPSEGRTRAAAGRARLLGADFVVVLAHWGIEYQSEPPPSLRALAARFAGAGVDLVIGTHSHVIGAVEDFGPTRVYYSLGNFIFDQYWDESVRCGLAVSLTLTKKGSLTTASYATTNTHLEPSGATTLGCPF